MCTEACVVRMTPQWLTLLQGVVFFVYMLGDCALVPTRSACIPAIHWHDNIFLVQSTNYLVFSVSIKVVGIGIKDPEKYNVIWMAVIGHFPHVVNQASCHFLKFMMMKITESS